MRVPPELRVDALELKDYCQASVREQLAGLTGEERTRKMRELAENGPLGEWWKRLRSRESREASGRSASTD